MHPCSLRLELRGKIVSASRRRNGCEATAGLSNQHARRARYPELTMSLGDGNDRSRHLYGSGFRLIRDQLAQERNQHDEHNTDCEAASAKLGEELPIFGI